MQSPFRRFDLKKTIIAAVFPVVAMAQTAAYRAPRAADGHADLGGIWQAINSANWDLQDHSAQPGTMWQTGSIGAEPAGQRVVEGGSIPYKQEKLAKKKDNFANRRTNDPEAKCYMPGVPRGNYMPYPFQIVQSPKGILLVYEFASANRFVNMGKPEEAGSDTWMGTNNGHWEGDTLVIDPGRGFRQQPIACGGTIHARGPVPYQLRSHHRRPFGIHQALEDQHAAV
jgi:hypothetical protein